MEPIRQREILTVVLLQTLASKPEGMKVPAVNDAISEDFTFPEEWYRELPDSKGYDTLKDLGYSDWRKIPQEKLIELVTTEPQWKNEIRWARNELRKEKWLDTSAPRGLWRLTPAGIEAAKHPEQHVTLTDREREIATPKPQQRQPRKDAPVPGHKTGLSDRERLLATLMQLANPLPLSELELLVDLARVVRRRNLPEDPL
jgi:hypothetical protein